MNLWLAVESAVPRTLSTKLQTKLSFASDAHNTKQKVGFIYGYPFLMGIALAIIANSLLAPTNLLLLAGTFIGGTAATFIILYLIVDYYALARARTLEMSLPDALELISTNISSGLTVENSLVESARPEFGELAVFLKRAAKEMFAGNTFELSLKEIGQKIDSSVLQRTIWLITEGTKKGAALGDLLLRVAIDLREESAMKKEISANISMYITLIIIATAFGAPVLFAASGMVSELLGTQTTNIANIGSTSTTIGIPLLGTLFNQKNSAQESIPPGLMQIFSVISLVCTSLFASLLIGIIKFNKETAGLRYFPPIVITALIVYFLAVTILGQFLSGGNFF
jgi:Flp pilus assembly protein TadB